MKDKEIEISYFKKLSKYLSYDNVELDRLELNYMSDQATICGFFISVKYKDRESCMILKSSFNLDFYIDREVDLNPCLGIHHIYSRIIKSIGFSL